MIYPEFRDAELSISNTPIDNLAWKLFKTSIRCILWSLIFIISFITTYNFFRLILLKSDGGVLLNAISVGASAVTIFSAIISVLSLLDSDCLKKYDDNIELLEIRYLNGKKISRWEFLKRSSCNRNNNYFVTSARYKFFSSNDSSKTLEVIVPVLSIDFKNIPCIKQILRIRAFMPEYFKYINNEQQSIISHEGSYDVLSKQPNYYIPLPTHIIALYKNVLIHKMIVKIIVINFFFITSAILNTIIWML